MEDTKKALEERGMVIRFAFQVILAEDVDPAYKDVNRIAEVSDKIGIATRVIRLAHLAVVKG